MSNLSSNIYQTRLTYNNVSAVDTRSSPILQDSNYFEAPLLAASNKKASIKLQTSGNEDDFGVAGVNVVQFQCSKNCQ